jgi:hypothetical protein
VQAYPVRTSHRKNLAAGPLEELMRTHFGPASRDGESVAASYGAIDRIVASGRGRELVVEVTMNPKVPEEVARETIARYNRFLEAATGFSSKERARRLRKSATASGEGG